MIRKKIRRLFCLLIISVFAVDCWAVPAQINFQGLLENSNGQVHGTINMTFRLYDTEEHGTLCWEEEQDVSVLQGIYNVILGTGRMNLSYYTLEKALLLNDELWLEVHIMGETKPMAPRQKITSVGFAIRAGVADSVPDASITNTKLANESISTSKLEDGAVTAVKVFDGSGSNLNADLLDGKSSEDFINITGGQIQTKSFSQALTVNNTGSGDSIHASVSGDSARGVVGTATNSENVTNYGGWFQADGLKGIGVYAKGGTNGLAAQFDGNIEILGKGNGIVFPDGSRIDKSYNGFFSNRIRVAPQGAVFNTIQAAIDSISPTEQNPYVIEIAPGTYKEVITLKSWIHLVGSGVGSTIVMPASYFSTQIVNLSSLSGVKMSQMTLYDPRGDIDVNVGIRINASSLILERVRIEGFTENRIFARNGSSLEILYSEIDGGDLGGKPGIYLMESDAVVMGTHFNNNTDCGVNFTIYGTLNVKDCIFEGSPNGVSADHFNDELRVVLTNNRFVDCGILIENGTDGNFIITSNFIEGGIFISGTPHTSIELIGNLIKGNRTIIEGGQAQIAGNWITGDSIRIEGEQAQIVGNWIFGNGVRLGGQSQIVGNNIKGLIEVDNGSVTISDNRITGNVQVTNGTYAAKIIGNDIGGDLIDSGSLNGYQGHIIGNAIGGTLSVSSDNAVVFANSVNGTPGPQSGSKFVTNRSIHFETTSDTIKFVAGSSEISMDASGAISIQSGSDLTVRSGGDLTVEAGQTLLLKGANVNIESAINLNLSADVDVKVESGNTMGLFSGSEMDITSDNLVDVNGLQIQLN